MRDFGLYTFMPLWLECYDQVCVCLGSLEVSAGSPVFQKRVHGFAKSGSHFCIQIQVQDNLLYRNVAHSLQYYACNGRC